MHTPLRLVDDNEQHTRREKTHQKLARADDDDESVPFFVGCLAKTESNLENSNFCICVLPSMPLLLLAQHSACCGVSVCLPPFVDIWFARWVHERVSHGLRDFLPVCRCALTRLYACVHVSERTNVCLHDMHIESILPYPIPHRFNTFSAFAPQYCKHKWESSVRWCCRYRCSCCCCRRRFRCWYNKNTAQREPILSLCAARVWLQCGWIFDDYFIAGPPRCCCGVSGRLLLLLLFVCGTRKFIQPSVRSFDRPCIYPSAFPLRAWPLHSKQ